MKIVFLAHNIRNDNGGGVLAGRIIEGLRRELSAKITILTTEFSGLPFEKPFQLRSGIFFIFDIFSLRRELKQADGIHVFDIYPYGIAVALAGLGLRKKLVITAIGSGSIIPLYRFFLRPVVRCALRRADAVIAISRFTRDEILKKIPNLSVSVIAPGIEPINHESIAIPEHFQKLKPYILSVGALRWRKGYERSIRAFAQIAGDFSALTYVIIGKKYSDAEYEKLTALIDELCLRNRVRIISNVESREELWGAYRGAELFCLISQNSDHNVEGFGMVFVEAAAMGLPVIGSRGCGVEDATDLDKNAILVGERNVHECAEALRTLLSDATTKTAFAEHSLQFAKNFYWDTKIAAYKDVYKNLEKSPIVYITNARLPTEKAHGLATVKLCEAMGKRGERLHLIAPLRWGETNDLFRYYSIQRTFRLTYLPTIDLLFLPFGKRFFFLLQLFSFSLIAALYAFLKYGRELRRVVFFSHDSIPLWFVSFFSNRIFYDIHHYPDKNFFYRRLMKKARAFSVQTRWKVESLMRDFHLNPKEIIYWPNGTDVDFFINAPSKSEARKRLGLSQTEQIVLYTGQLFEWKGVETLLRAAPLIPDAHVSIVGGSHEDRTRVQKTIPEAGHASVRYIDFQPHSMMPIWLRAADVLVLPNTGKQKVSLFYTSPMKLFEYMASGTPIVASDIPSIREVLSEAEGFFAEADNPQSFAKAITYALAETEEAKRRGENAREKSRYYTWDERAKRIIAHMGQMNKQLTVSIKKR